ncbi:15817_t:CDS:2 [Rhizophagus irregularis]|nr:15817_t:CDS:2 [Rhizophagus irregularis]
MMGNEDNFEEDQIEWGQSYIYMCYKPKGSSPNSSRKIVRHTNSLEIPLKQINFNSSTSSTSQAIHASTEEDLALFFDDKTEVSIFLNNMKDEVSFGIKEYYYHPKGFSFRSNCVPRDMDPTGGKLNGVTCIIFQSSIPIERNDFELIDGWIRAMINRSKNSNYSDSRRMRHNDFTDRNRVPPRVQNSSAKPDDPLDILPINYDNAMKKRELYITCIYPTQKRAIIYPSDGIFNHFQFHIKQRFGWKWERMWYKNNKTGGWNTLNNEDVWAAVKKQVMNKPVPRIEVFMR